MKIKKEGETLDVNLEPIYVQIEAVEEAEENDGYEPCCLCHELIWNGVISDDGVEIMCGSCFRSLTDEEQDRFLTENVIPNVEFVVVGDDTFIVDK